MPGYSAFHQPIPKLIFFLFPKITFVTGYNSVTLATEHEHRTTAVCGCLAVEHCFRNTNGCINYSKMTSLQPLGSEQNTLGIEEKAVLKSFTAPLLK